jgi:hypothetical protein
MNAQEIFDTAVRHLFTQGKRGGKQANYYYGSEGFKCQYRGEDGTKCAVGALIPDELYDPLMDRKSIRAHKLSEWFPCLPAFFKEQAEFLDQLQYIHDADGSWIDEATLKERLKVLALWFNLSSEVLDDLHLPA